MADSLVDSAVKKMEELALQELKLQTEVGKKVQGLKDDLEWLRVLLRHADQLRRQEFNDYIELWVRQTREVAFDAEDLLEEYFHRGQLHCHGVLDLPSFLRWLRKGVVGLFVRHSICDHIDGVKNRLEEIKRNSEEHDLKSIPSTWTHPPQKHYVDWYKLNEYTIEDPDKLVGVQDNSDKIKKWLMGPEEKRIVIAITGKSGIGKTTLASSIYEGRKGSKVRGKFDCTIWVHIPQKFRMEDVLGEIIQDATGVDVTEPEKTELTKPRDDDGTWITSKLAATLGGKKYLIVLDDVPSLEEWKFFLAVLPDDGKTGSRVVITSQVKPTAPHGSGTGDHGEMLLPDTNGRPCLYHHHVELKKLEKDDGRKMFCRRVFDREEFPDDFRHKDIHSEAIRNLLEHCLPLSVTLLAGLLRTKKEEEWNSVIKPLQKYTHQRSRKEKQLEEKEEEEEVEEGEEKGGGDEEKQKAKKKKVTVSIPYRQQPLVDRILMLSFDDLPPHLKKCFLYFAAFKAEAHIASEKLIRLWVAEGFVQNTDGRTMEELGQEYLKMLISRCLINLVDVGYNNNIVTVSIHERVLAFARAEAHETNFLHVRSNTNELSRATIRRLSIQNTFDLNTRLILAAPKLRSLLCEIPRAPSDEAKEGMESCFWPNNGISIFEKVSGFFMGGTVNSFSIYRCKFLRVIDLNGGAKATSASLPEEIGWLIHLRYLRLAHTKFQSLPNSVAKLRNLQTLDITSTEIRAVPKGFWEIKSLRHVLARRLNKGPCRIDALDNLQTLHGVPWGKWAQKGAALKKMTNLRSLQVWRLSKGQHCQYLLSALTSMECLVSMEMVGWEEDQGADSKPNKRVGLPLNELVTVTVQRHLQYLRLDGQVNKFQRPPADQIHSHHLPNLTKLELRKSGLVQDHIDMIGNLPNLAELILGEGSYIEEDMVIPSGGFRELRKLRLKGLPNLMTWEVKDTNRSALWHLERMTIINCTNLTMIPDYLLKLEHLVLLTFHDVPKLLKLPHYGNFRQRSCKYCWKNRSNMSW